MNVFITDVAAFLPNRPISDDEMEEILGRVGGMDSRTKRLVLRRNGIHSRHYAIHPETGEMTHTNARMTAEAIRRLKPHPDFDLEAVDCLCCGTATPDQLLPGHGPMVHAELGSPPLEVVTTAGICLSGVTALKYGCMGVAGGLFKSVVAAASEHSSSFLRMPFIAPKDSPGEEEVKQNPPLAFDAEFLRWMLSDGAGAVHLSPKPREGGLSLLVDWIELVSFANVFDTCMYAGATKEEGGGLKGWRAFPTPVDAMAAGCFAIQQDVRLLNREIVGISVDRTLPRVIEKHGLRARDVDWYLPHYSSDFFRQDLYDGMKEIGFEIPFERWFTNLSTKGNTGAASIFIILEELFHSGKIEQGQRLLCFVPESGRFSIAYMGLTAL